MDDRRIDQMADTIDDIAVALEEIKEGRNCALNEEQLEQVHRQLEDIRSRLDEVENQAADTSSDARS